MRSNSHRRLHATNPKPKATCLQTRSARCHPQREVTPQKLVLRLQVSALGSRLSGLGSRLSGLGSRVAGLGWQVSRIHPLRIHGEDPTMREGIQLLA